MRCALVTLSLAIIVWCTADIHAKTPSEPERIPILGTVVDEQSRAVAGASVRGHAYTDQTEATTDSLGRFELNVLKERVGQLAVVAIDAEGDRIGTYRAKWSDPSTAESPLTIQLGPSRRISVEVTDAQGALAAGVFVGAVIHFAPLVSAVTDADGKCELILPTDTELKSLYASKRGEGFDYRVVHTARDPSYEADWLSDVPVKFSLAKSQTVQIRLIDEDEQPVTKTELDLWLLNKPGEPDSFNLSFAPAEFRATTDGSGIATFRGVPEWNVHPLIFWPRHDQYVRERIVFDPREHPDGRATATLQRFVPLSGRVRFADGRAATDINVIVAGAGYSVDGFYQAVTTDHEGHFGINVNPDLLYMVAVRDQQWAAPAIDGLIVRPGTAVEGLEFELRPATRVHGRVTIGPDKKPVAAQQMVLRHSGRDLHHLDGAELPNPTHSNRWVQPSIQQQVTTDEEGQFEFFAGPGSFSLSGPSQAEPQTFEIIGEPEFVFDFSLPRPEKGPFAGRVVTGDPPQPVDGAIIDGKYRTHRYGGHDLRLKADEQGRFAGERALHTTVLRAISHDGKLAGIIEIGPDDEEATIPIAPVAAASARLVDAVTGDALPNSKVWWGRRVHKGDDDAHWETAWGGTVVTDSQGRFELHGMVVGQEYWLSVPRDDQTYGSLPSFTPSAAETTELGDLRLKPPYKPPTFEERVERELLAQVSTDERYQNALQEAERLRQNVLVVFVRRDAQLTESWFKLRLEDQSVRSALYNYQLIQLDVESESAQTLAERLGVALDERTLPIWRFCTAKGDEPDVAAIPRQSDHALDQAAVLESLDRHAPEPLDARQLMNDALAEAAKTNRRVIVQETATWCGPCHRLARYLERQRAIWEKDYIWVRIDQRWHGSKQVMTPIRDGRSGGIPWYAILDASGNVLTTSNRPDGDNIGFPSEAEGVDHFISMISSTRQRLSEQDLAALRAGFAK